LFSLNSNGTELRETALLNKTPCYILPLFAVIFFVIWSAVYYQNKDNTIMLRDADYKTTAVSLAEPDTITSESSRYRNSVLSHERQAQCESLPYKGEIFRFFVTPESQTIKALAAQTHGYEDAYQMALQWIYVSDEKLNHSIDKWLTPHEFLTNVPHYPGNPLPGKAVSDCEEKANTLVSIIRAQGVQPEEVRVVLGEVTFGDSETGHAWVELYLEGQWTVLDPCLGPYWDDRFEKLICRQGVPFQYYRSHVYPVLQVWIYYNDVYHLDVRSVSGDAPVSWGVTAPAK
jgi:hypothetical protein